MDIDQEFTINDDPLSATNKLRVFVSSSMGKELLKHYVNQAKNYGATLVFNGLPENSWRKLSELVYEITVGNAEGIEIQLDDVAFAEYGVTSVPTFVLSSEASVFDGEEIGATGNKFDKVSGNIGIRRALEEIIKHGDLSDKSEHFLTKNGIRE